MEIKMKFSSLKALLKILLIFTLPLSFVACTINASASEEDTISRTFKAAENGTLTMDVERASIEINTHGTNEIKVSVIKKIRTTSKSKARRISEDYKIDFRHSDEDLFIESDYREKSRLFSWFSSNRIRVRFILSVPQKYNLKLKTSGGSITVSDIEGDVNARTSGGSLTFNEIDGTLWAKTSGGSIKLDECTGEAEVRTSGGSLRIGKVKGSLKARTSGGSISVNEVAGTINASTSGGSISAHISKQPKNDCSLTTSGGTITVSLQGDLKLDVDAKTSGGRVRTDFPVTIKGEISKRKLKAEMNGGGPELYLRTSGGSIYIKELE
jgi:hypothetical protein